MAKTVRLIEPFDSEAEQAVLGSVLLRPGSILEVANLISPQDFYRVDHGKIFGAMLDLDRPVSPSTSSRSRPNSKRKGPSKRSGDLFLSPNSRSTSAPLPAFFIMPKGLRNYL
jgi:hypothetical protein